MKNSNLKRSKKTEQWYKDKFLELTSDSNTFFDKYEKFIRLYAILNNDFSYYEQEILKWCSPEMQDYFSLDDVPLISNRVYSKVQTLLGTAAFKNNKFTASTLGSNDSEEVDEKYRTVLREEIMRVLLLKMEEMSQRLQGASESDIQAFIQENGGYELENIENESFKSDLDLLVTELIQYFESSFDVKMLSSQALFHAIVTSEALVNVDYVHGKLKPVVMNPLFTFYHKSPEEPYIEKGDYWGYRIPVTKTMVLDEIGHMYSEEEIDSKVGFIGNFSELFSSNRLSSPTIISSLEGDIYDKFNMFGYSNEIGQYTSNEILENKNTQYTWKTYLQFKAYKDIVLVTKINEFGQQVTEVFSEEYEIPKEAVRKNFTNRYGNKSVKWEWIDEDGNPVYAEKLPIPRRYEVTRYGNDLYVNMRECLYQPLDITDIYGSFRLSLTGRTFGGVNSVPVSLVERVIPLQLQYIVIKTLQMRELSKYEGQIKQFDVDKIPNWLIEDEDGNPLFEGADVATVSRYYMRKLGEVWYSSSQNSNGLYQGPQAPPLNVSNTSNIGDILALQNLAEAIDREISLQMLVVPQQEGTAARYSTATENAQAMQASQVISELFYSTFADLWKNVIEEWLRCTLSLLKRKFKENPNLTEIELYYNTSNSTKNLIKVKPDYLDFKTLGVHIQDNIENIQYRQIMMNFLLPIAQNAGQGSELISSLVMSLVKGDPPEKIHKQIIELAKAQNDRMMQMEMARQNAQQMMLQKEIENREDRQAHELEMLKLKNQNKLETTAMQVTSFLGPNRDIDKSGVDDAIENRQTIHEMLIKERDLSNKERKLSIEERKLAERQKELNNSDKK